ncbi:MAG: SPOR domain-containing protein [Oceanibaculum nanhaiense]|nr:SPOR domain-containing protein [Oceanibaculum nanhaiense]
MAEPKPEPKAEPKPTAAPAQTQASIAAVSGGGFKVQLAAVRSDEAAKQEWNRLKNRYKEELGALSLTVQRVDLGAGKGVYHRIQAGPLDEAAAERACTALKAKNQACLVVRP